MKLIPVVCPQCGAKLKLPEGTTKTNCQFCGNDIMLDKGEVVVIHKADVKGEWARLIALVEKHAEQNNMKEVTQYGKRLIELNPDSPLSWFYYGASYTGEEPGVTYGFGHPRPSPVLARAVYKKALAEGWTLYDKNPMDEESVKFEALVAKEVQKAQWNRIKSFIWNSLGCAFFIAVAACLFFALQKGEPECLLVGIGLPALCAFVAFLGALSDIWFVVTKNKHNYP